MFFNNVKQRKNNNDKNSPYSSDAYGLIYNQTKRRMMINNG